MFCFCLKGATWRSLNDTLKGSLMLAQTSQDQALSTKEIYLPQRDKGQGIRDKDRRQETRERGKGVCPDWRVDKGLPLDREEAGVAHRKMAVYKGTGRKSALGWGVYFVV